MIGIRRKLTKTFVINSQRNEQTKIKHMKAKTPQRPITAVSPPVTKTTVIAEAPAARKKGFFTTLIGTFFTMTFIAVLALIAIVIHSVLIYNIGGRYDAELKGKLLDLGNTSKPQANQQVVLKIPTEPPLIVVKKANDVVELINTHLFKVHEKKDPAFVLPKFSEKLTGKTFDMTISLIHVPFLSIFIVFLYTLLSKMPVNIAQTIEGGGAYNNSYPRAQQAKLRGWGARALYAHENSFEAFAPFAIAVILYMCRFGFFMSINAHNVDFAVLLIKECVLFVAARTVFHIFYILNISLLRSVVWFISFVAVCNLYLQTFVQH
jgi:uncharacterized MAPEG superfamily protein